MLPSNVNNAIREMMAHLKDMDAGTQALTSPPSPPKDYGMCPHGGMRMHDLWAENSSAYGQTTSAVRVTEALTRRPRDDHPMLSRRVVADEVREQTT